MLAFLSIFVVVIIAMIAMGVESKGHVPIQATTTVSFREGFLAVTNIIFAYRTSSDFSHLPPRACRNACS